MFFKVFIFRNKSERSFIMLSPSHSRLSHLRSSFRRGSSTAQLMLVVVIVAAALAVIFVKAAEHNGHLQTATGAVPPMQAEQELLALASWANAPIQDFVKKNNRLPTANEAQIALQLLAQPPAVQSQLMVVNGPSYRFMNDESYEILFPTKNPANPGVWIVFPYTKAGVLMLPMNGTKFMNALPGIGPNTQMEAPR